MTPVAHASDGARAEQWALKAYGAENNLVWNHSTGKGVTVAVIDTGVRATHVDLTGQILPGTDFAFGGKGWTDHSSTGHGTGIASIIASHGHGSGGEDGIMGLAPGAKILPIGIGDGVESSGGANYVAQAIRYAVDHGAEVINMSIAGPTPNPEDEQAVAYAEQHNVVLVAGAGNDGSSAPMYPASYPGVIKVGAVDKTGTIWSGSNTGGITVMGAGVKIVRDDNGSDTQMYEGDGTSYATAYVSAIAALFRSAYPDLTQGQIVNRIVKTAIMPSGLKAPDDRYGYGLASPDFKTKVAPGPAAGPLPQATSAAGSPGTGANSGSSADTSTTASGSSSSSMVIVLGVVGALVVIVIIVVVVVRSRRGGGGGGGQGGNGGGGQPGYTGYPQGQPQQYQPQQQAYQPPTGQYGQNPYAGGAPQNKQFPPQQGYGGNQGR